MTQTNDYVNNLYKANNDKFNTTGRKPLKFAVISDLHIDYAY